MDIISLHIPKTAGTSLRLVFEEVYGDSLVQDYPDRHDNPLARFDGEKLPKRKQAGIEMTMPAGTRIVHGHFLASKYDGLYPDAKRITWVRNPISRLVSHYFYLKNVKGSARHKPNGLRQKVLDENMSLLDFAKLPQIRSHQHRRWLEKRSLEEFDFVGVMEYFHEDVQDLGRLLGWPRVNVPFVNQTPGGTYKNFSLDMNTLEKLYLLNLEDIEMYRKAIRLRTLRRKNEV